MIEDTNKQQADSLSALRQSIQANKMLFDKKQMDQIEIFPMEYRDIPCLLMEDQSEFQQERYTELCMMVDTLYWNYKVSIEKNENIVEKLKELTKWVDELLFEAIKPRWS